MEGIWTGTRFMAGVQTLTNAADTVKAYYDEHPTAYSSKRQMIDEWITKYTNPDPQG